VDREPALRAQLGTVAAHARDGLLVGGPRLASDREARNAAYLIGTDGDIRATYDKRRLVPFAEYNPLPGLTDPPEGPVYTPGGIAEAMPVGAATRLGTVICYEILFPNLIRDLVGRGADVLVNLSNDSWLDAAGGAASRQHFSMTIFRAIESRRFLVRAAGSGASGFVSPYGVVYGLLAAGTAGATVGRVEPRTERTVYVRWGEAWIVVVAAILAARLRRHTGAVA
jgi:apolipoprotein N-acyltransferase